MNGSAASEVLGAPGAPYAVGRQSDQTYRPGARRLPAVMFSGSSSVEGPPFGADLVVRYAIDAASRDSLTLATRLPDNIEGEIIEPVGGSGRHSGSGALHRARNFLVEARRNPADDRRRTGSHACRRWRRIALGADGQGRAFDDHRRGMESRWRRSWNQPKMRFTLELKGQAGETALEAEAQKVRREKAAEAVAVNEQLIAVRAQEEAMKHVRAVQAKSRSSTST